MRARALLAVMVFCLIAAPCFARGKHRVWKTGTLIDLEPGLPSGGRAAIAFTAVAPQKLQLYTVDTDQMIYEFSAYVGQGAGDSHPLTVDHPVKFWLDPKQYGRVLLVDDNGKVFKGSVVKSVAKRAAPGD